MHGAERSCHRCRGKGTLPSGAADEDLPELPPVVAAVLVNAVRAMESAGLPEARELRELLRPDLLAKLVRRPMMRSVPQGDYECIITKHRLGPNGRSNSRQNLIIDLHCTPVHAAGPAASPNTPGESRAYVSSLVIPFPDEQQDGATYVGMRWLRYLLATTEVPAEFNLVGRKVMMTYGPTGSRDWIGWGPFPKGTWK